MVNTLMPEPAHVTAARGTLPLTNAFSVQVARFDSPRLEGAIRRALRRLSMQAGLTLAPAPAATPATLTITVAGAGEAVQSIGEDESYDLEVTPQGATLTSRTVVGAMRGLTTLTQLIQTGGDGYFLPAVHIEDAPRFRWRGLMIDSGRHFEPVAVILRTLDGMAAVKLNVFHWHLTEDQGFRIESKVFPKLTGMGSNGQFYTQAQAREVVAYARARGIRVVPEFDMPAHSTSWLVGYPELGSAPGPFAISPAFGVRDGTLDPTRDSTYQFIDKFIGEMAAIFPDPYMHIGGDESNGKEWRANPRIAAFMRAHHFATTAELQTYFNQRLAPILAKHGKKMVGWDEVLNPALPKNVVVESWRGVKSLAQGAALGYQGILAAPYYLDHMETAGTMYLADPIPAGTSMPPAEQKLVLGGEVCMWGELVDAGTIDSRMWPRSAAIAERFWSPASVTDVNDMYRRLTVESTRLEALGLTHRTHEAAALRQLAGSSDIGALQVFASVLAPLNLGQRQRQQHATPFTPFDRLGDAVRPDPAARRELDAAIQAFIAAPTAAGAAALKARFQQWTAAVPEVERQMDASPLLALARPRAEQLPALAQAGEQAADFIQQGTDAPAGWQQQQLDLISAAEKPQTLVRFTFLPELRKLVQAVPAH
ncbi:MAG TPA: family 20 glycosylhydrolase [Terriglobales bacterium]